MAKQVFISHSSKDKDMAEAIYQYLTSQGIRCWIDLHDIRPGIPYAREIMRGIDASDLLLVVYSHHVNSSDDMLNEIEEFHKAKKTILPFLTENVPFSRELGYYLNRKQWITAYNGYSSQLSVLRDAIVGLLQLPLQHSLANQQVQTSSSSSNRQERSTAVPTTASAFDVILRNAGAAKLQVVKAVKEVCGLDLKTAKNLVDSAPSVLVENIDFANASALKNYIEEAGAMVEIKPTTASGISKRQKPGGYSLLLKETGANKLQAVKVVKETIGIGLKEAKDLVDEAPSILQKGMQPWEAQTKKRILEMVGIEVEVLDDETAEVNRKMYKAAARSLEADKEFEAKRFDKAIALYKEAVNTSDRYEYFDFDCTRIAYAYYIGQGVDKNYNQSVKWYRMAANHGYSHAQLNLGVMYQNGCGVLRNNHEAAQWYKKAAEQGNETAKKYLEELKPYL